MTVEHVIGKRPTVDNIPAIGKALAELNAQVGSWISDAMPDDLNRWG